MTASSPTIAPAGADTDPVVVPEPDLVVALDAVRDIVIVLDDDNTVIHANRAAVTTLALPADPPAQLDVLGALTATESDLLRRTGRWQGQLLVGMAGRTQRRLPVELQLVDSASGSRLIVRAPTGRDTHDPVTGCLDRTGFIDRVETLLIDLAASGGGGTLLLLDIDAFRRMSISIGPKAGDQILGALAARLRQAFPSTATIGRVGGDEFAVFWPGSHDPARAADRVSDACSTPLYLDGNEVSLTTTIGAALSGGITDAGELIRNADTAASRAKEHGPGRVHVFDAKLAAEGRRRLDGEQALRRAIRNDELRLHYQPMVALTTGHITRLEALIRWQPPGAPLRSPAAFMELAETSGLIVPMGRWVAEQACRQLAAWNRPGLRMALNLSIRQLADPAFVAELGQVISDSGVAPDRIELEITESMLMDDVEMVSAQLVRCRDMGLTISIDDFGTGYSSLQYLRDLPIDSLKIDRSFVAGIAGEGRDRPIVGAVLALARALGLESVAEGVELAEQLDALRSMGCDYAQGYHLARPLAADDLDELLVGEPLW